MNRLKESVIKEFKSIQYQISSAAASSKSAKEYVDLEPFQHLIQVLVSRLKSLAPLLGLSNELAILPPTMGNNAWNAKSELQILKICVDAIELSLIKAEEKTLEQKEFLIESGKSLTANTLISQILQSATKSLKIVDNYLSDESASLIESATNSNVSVEILTTDYSEDKINSFLQKVEIIKKGWKSTFEIKKTHSFHDRYIIIDENVVWLSGPSLDSLGMKKPGVICELTDIKDDIIKKFNEEWKFAEIISIKK